MADSNYYGEFLGHLIFILGHEVTGLKYGATFPRVRVSVATDKAIFFLRDNPNGLPEDLA